MRVWSGCNVSLLKTDAERGPRSIPAEGTSTDEIGIPVSLLAKYFAVTKRYKVRKVLSSRDSIILT